MDAKGQTCTFQKGGGRVGLGDCADSHSTFPIQFTRFSIKYINTHKIIENIIALLIHVLLKNDCQNIYLLYSMNVHYVFKLSILKYYQEYVYIHKYIFFTYAVHFNDVHNVLILFSTSQVIKFAHIHFMKTPAYFQIIRDIV